MILLDTNIVSEAWRPRPDSRVIAWLDSQPADSLYICTPVLAELRYGSELLSDGERKNRLEDAYRRVEETGYRGRILPFDVAAAHEFGRLTVARKRIGRRIEPLDAFIAAIALTHEAKLATRDVSGFQNLGLDLINPFEAVVS